MAAIFSLVHKEGDSIITYNGITNAGLKRVPRDFCLVVTSLFNHDVISIKDGGGLLWSRILGNRFLVRRHNILTIKFDSPIYSEMEHQDLTVQSGVTVNFDVDLSFDGAEKFLNHRDAVAQMAKVVESIVVSIVKNSKYGQLLGGPIITADSIPEYLDEIDVNIRKTIREKILYVQNTFGLTNIQIVYPDVNLPQSIITAQEEQRAASIRNKQAEAEAESLVRQAEFKAQASRTELAVDVEKKMRLTAAVLAAVRKYYPDVDPALILNTLRENGTNISILGGNNGSENTGSVVDMAALSAMLNQNCNISDNTNGVNSNTDDVQSLGESGPTR